MGGPEGAAHGPPGGFANTPNRDLNVPLGPFAQSGRWTSTICFSIMSQKFGTSNAIGRSCICSLGARLYFWYEGRPEGGGLRFNIPTYTTKAMPKEKRAILGMSERCHGIWTAEIMNTGLVTLELSLKAGCGDLRPTPRRVASCKPQASCGLFLESLDYLTW